MTSIKQRLAALRQRMKEENIAAYMVPTEDFHASEYVGDFFKCRKYVTGFTGSAGTAVIMQDMAGLWTDGRYFIQAAAQLEGSGIQLFKMGEPGVPTVHAFLQDSLKDGDILGFDGRTVGAGEYRILCKELSAIGASIRGDLDLVGDIWEDRPALSCEPVMELGISYAGKSRSDKLKEVRSIMEEKKADLFLLSSLDDIAWLLNIRGGDVECNPVLLSYLLMDMDEVLLFANEKAFSEDVRKSLLDDGVRILPYDDVYERVRDIPAGRRVLLCRAKLNSLLDLNLPEGADVLDEDNPTLLMKAVKNPVEADNVRKAHIKDAAAVIRFIYWLKQNAGKPGVTELSAEEKLYEFRSEQEHFMGNSFSPIISYGPHAAIVHYSATEETDVPIERKGMVLCDTGGQYLEGTTDITRTVVTGELTEEEKIYFTEVLRGHINLARAVFRYGCTGQNLDYLAREPLWKMGKDYNHGTGHGVGYFLNVHEGPNGFRWKSVPERRDSAVFEEGMITSDEPGYYEEGKFGIRHESLLLCKTQTENDTARFMCFEELTLVPFDLEGILPERMTKEEKEFLNDYHKRVYDTISPLLPEEEKAWLKEAARSLDI